MATNESNTTNPSGQFQKYGLEVFVIGGQAWKLSRVFRPNNTNYLELSNNFFTFYPVYYPHSRQVAWDIPMPSERVRKVVEKTITKINSHLHE